MTATKAIEYLEQIDNRIGLKYVNGEADAYVPDYLKKAVYIAIQALREKLERENPQPLGLEELGKLVDEPVWLDTGEMLLDEQIVGCYEILERVTQEPTKVFWFTRRVRGFIAQDYGKTWIAYRYEPKGNEHIGEATNMVEGE